MKNVGPDGENLVFLRNGKAAALQHWTG
jgi:hypothetical protein